MLLKLKFFYYNITIGIKNIFDWLPVIWKDREWEWNYFFDKILLHKLKRIVKYYHGDINEPKEIKICIRLIEKYWYLEEVAGEPEYDLNETWIKQKKIKRLLYNIIAKRSDLWWD